MQSFYQVIISCNWYNFMITQQDTAENHFVHEQESIRFLRNHVDSTDGGFRRRVPRYNLFLVFVLIVNFTVNQSGNRNRIR